MLSILRMPVYHILINIMASPTNVSRSKTKKLAGAAVRGMAI